MALSQTPQSTPLRGSKEPLFRENPLDKSRRVACEVALLCVVEDAASSFAIKGTLLGTPNTEPQEYSRYIIGSYLPGSLFHYIPTILLGFPVLGSHEKPFSHKWLAGWP